MAKRKPPQPVKKTKVSLVRSSAAEYLTFAANNELARKATIKRYLMVQTEGGREVQRKVALPYVLMAQV